MASTEKYISGGKTYYRARFRGPDRNTTRRAKDDAGNRFTSKRTAEQFAKDQEHGVRHGTYTPYRGGRTTVGELGPGWLNRHRGKPSTLHHIRGSWRVHVQPRWGHIAVGDIRYTAVDSWFRDLLDTGSPTRANRPLGILKGILRDAVRDGLIPANPATDVASATESKPREVALTEDQLGRFVDESSRSRLGLGGYRALALLLGVCGPRWGEAVALRVCDVDFMRNRIHIHRNAVEVNGTIYLGTPKTGEARTIPVPESVKLELSKVAQGKGLEDLLWPAWRPSDKNAGFRVPPGQNSWHTGVLKRCREADPDFPKDFAIRDLRRTASVLARRVGGLDTRERAGLLGHKPRGMTDLVYTPLGEEDFKVMEPKLEKVAQLVSKRCPDGAQDGQQQA